MLQQFGFTQYESQIYQALISADQPLDATGIVKLSAVPRSKVYEVLHRLAEKGIILETTVEKKRLYTALPVESVISRLKADFETSVQELREAAVKKPVADDRVWTLKDNHSILSLLEEMLGRAERKIILSAWGDELEKYAELLEEKHESGVSIHVHSIGKIKTSLPSVSVLIPDKHHETLERSRIAIIDEEEMLFAGMEAGKWNAITTRSRPLVKFFAEFFYHDVALTEITQKYKDTIMEDKAIRDVLLKLRY